MLNIIFFLAPKVLISISPLQSRMILDLNMSMTKEVNQNI